MKLRPYQEKGIADIRALFIQGKRRVCYAAPTASGTTILFTHAAKKVVENGQRAVINFHRQELIDQTCAALTTEGVSYGIIAAGMRNADRNLGADLSGVWCRSPAATDRTGMTPEPLIELDGAAAFEQWLAHGSFKAVIGCAGNDEARLVKLRRRADTSLVGCGGDCRPSVRRKTLRS
jgi:hypothetical protein